MEDKRVPCKYGVLCYQKNSQHLEKYKHDDDKNEVEENDGPPPEKKAKEDDQKASEVTSSPEGPVEKPASPVDVKENLKHKFLVSMPEEFFSFWKFCKSLSSSKPQEALLSCGLRLVGPFDVLSGAMQGTSYTQDELLCHWRYYYDPPEFQTLLQGDDKKQFHMGYFRDSPFEPPVFVASNSAAENCVFKQIGHNLFSAVNSHLSSVLRTADPFKKLSLKKLQTSLQAWAKKDDISLFDDKEMAKRNKAKVTLTFHKAGIVTPYNKTTTIGYRQLETDAKLKRLLDAIAKAETDERRDKEMEELDLLINNANIGNDENDFGGALELGINLFCHGHEGFHPQILGLLSSTYMLLGRQPFSQILQSHLKNRKKGVKLSALKTE